MAFSAPRPTSSVSLAPLVPLRLLPAVRPFTSFFHSTRAPILKPGLYSSDGQRISNPLSGSRESEQQKRLNTTVEANE